VLSSLKYCVAYKYGTVLKFRLAIPVPNHNPNPVPNPTPIPIPNPIRNP